MFRKGTRYLFILLINLLIIGIIDYVSGYFLPVAPVYKSNLGYFSSNYRNYYVADRLVDGTEIFRVPPSKILTMTYDQEKVPKHAQHVLTFGDSFTQGQGVAPHHAWPKQLEALSADNKILVSNHGQSGTDIEKIEQNFQQVLTSKSAKGAHFAIYALVLNDPYYFPNQLGRFMDYDDKNNYGHDTGLYLDFIMWRTHVFDKNRSSWLNLIYRHSNVARFIITQMEVAQVAKNTLQFYHDIYDEEVNRLGLQQTFQAIEKMNHLAHKNGTKFLVMIFPLFYRTQSVYPFESIHQFLAAELTKRQIEVLDLYPTFKGMNDRDLWVHPSDQHPNDFAHGLVAKKVKNWLDSQTQKN